MRPKQKTNKLPRARSRPQNQKFNPVLWKKKYKGKVWVISGQTCAKGKRLSRDENE